MHFITRRNVVSSLGLSGFLVLAGIRPAAAEVVRIEQFMELMDGVLASKGASIAAGATVENGWEKWLQKEVMDTLAATHSTYDLAPEQHVYSNVKATTDFIGNGPTKERPNTKVTADTYVVELKCQGHADTFDAGLEEACDKLAKSALNATFQSARRYVFGVVIEPERVKFDSGYLVTKTAGYKFTKYAPMETRKPDEQKQAVASQQKRAADVDRGGWLYWRQITG